MIYPVYVYGSPVLRKVAEPVEEDMKGLQQLIEDLYETMYKSDGVGLAAPQIGVSKRIFVLDATPMAGDDPEVEGFKKAFINPVILNEQGEEWTFNEGCLSIPNIREDITRPSEILIEYYDEQFNFYRESYDGIKARIIQHEYDHLEGVLFVDRINPLRKRILRGKLNAISKGKVDINYKIKFPG
jgi:peptide deformylase